MMSTTRKQITTMHKLYEIWSVNGMWGIIFFKNYSENEAGRLLSALFWFFKIALLIMR